MKKTIVGGAVVLVVLCMAMTAWSGGLKIRTVDATKIANIRGLKLTCEARFGNAECGLKACLCGEHANNADEFIMCDDDYMLCLIDKFNDNIPDYGETNACLDNLDECRGNSDSATETLHCVIRFILCANRINHAFPGDRDYDMGQP